MEPTFILKSKRFWGMFITTVTAVLPLASAYLGWEINPAVVVDFGEAVNNLITAFGGVIGIVLTFYGSTDAKGPMVLSPGE